MRSAGGVYIVDDGNKQRETDTFTCGCCNGIVFVNPGQKPEDIGGLDWYTNKLICKTCVDGNRSPFEEKLKRMESLQVTRSWYA